MKLQIAIDMVDTTTAIKMVDQIYDVIDIVEIGTPMIIHEGVLPVERLKAKYPDLTILADTKIVDGGDIEASYAYDAGADIVTVLAMAPKETIRAVVETACVYGRMCMADMLCVKDTVERAVELEELGVDYICLHTAKDEQHTKKAPLDDLKKVNGYLTRAKTAVAGGICLKTTQSIVAIGADIVVVGSALTKAPDLREAVLKMKAAIRNNHQ
ncbi:MAG: 3-hexulose-6-phosphate synthase [Chloroflexota bacterium]|nr:3-hexulose-6-phosphate synthase [Chloroflexota bacterium]